MGRRINRCALSTLSPTYLFNTHWTCQVDECSRTYLREKVGPQIETGGPTDAIWMVLKVLGLDEVT